VKVKKRDKRDKRSRPYFRAVRVNKKKRIYVVLGELNGWNKFCLHDSAATED
jgi:hypothetical protein